MASRCIIGKVDGQGDGKAILCARGCYPDEAGAALLGRYSEEMSFAAVFDPVNHENMLLFYDSVIS